MPSSSSSSRRSLGLDECREQVVAGVSPALGKQPPEVALDQPDVWERHRDIENSGGNADRDDALGQAMEALAVLLRDPEQLGDDGER